MIISKSPLRISIAGGGTDLESFYSLYGSTFISAAINAYVYVAISKPFIQKYIIKYSKIEKSLEIKNIKHDLVRSILRKYHYNKEFIEITTTADVPYGTGLGSSGAFSNCLIQALSYINNENLNYSEIAERSYFIENKILKEVCGKQDPYASAYGGLSKFTIEKKGNVTCKRLEINEDELKKFSSNLLLFYTGTTRSSSIILSSQDQASKKKNDQIIKNLLEVQKKQKIIEKSLINNNFDEFGYLMGEHWAKKKERTPMMTNTKIDQLYNYAIENGALGGKIVGAGGGGFLLFYATNPNLLREKFKKLNVFELQFDFDLVGTSIVLNN